MLKNLSIKIKLVVIFILIKIIPLLLLFYVVYTGIANLEQYIDNNIVHVYKQNEKIIEDTTNKAIKSSIEALDEKSQNNLEKLSKMLADEVANFLYTRDEDLLFLSKIDINQKVLEDFYKSKNRDVIVQNNYVYDEKSQKWISKDKSRREKRLEKDSVISDNKDEFHYVDPILFDTKNIPIYKEVSFFNNYGEEIYKVSSIDKNLKNVSKKANTYVASEDYFDNIKKLKKGEIYVSDVIGQYVSSKIIGIFNKKNAKKANIKFEPEKYAFAGDENPVGKKFEGIIRFITPYFKDGEKKGYISLALDHKHIMEFADTLNSSKLYLTQSINSAIDGNYAFIWDYEGKSIVHPRHHSIMGYDKKTGKLAQPWLSKDIYEKYKNSNQEINEFLKSYPKFENQALSKKPSIEQIQKGNLGLDCRYLNFAPQCTGWMRVTKNGGYGSFMILWTGVKKLTTAAAIPYYTGKYKNSKRGFGFVTIGANVDDFHLAATAAQKEVSDLIVSQNIEQNRVLSTTIENINDLIKNLVDKLLTITVLLSLIIVLIAITMANYLSKRVNTLLEGSKNLIKSHFKYRIDISSNDEIGEVEKSFNHMASKIENLVYEQKNINKDLGKRVQDELNKRKKQEEILVEQSKLASMGEMIGNIAHQWRQPLNALGLILQNLRFSYKMGDLSDEQFDTSVNKASNLISNMSSTIDDFRNFYKPNKQKEKFFIEDMIDNSIGLVNSTLNFNHIEIKKSFLEDKILIEGYKNEFSQVIVNLLKNAQDAFVEKNIENPSISIETKKDKDLSQILISDNAGGIPLDIKDKIFEPYFTTKDEDKGTGIGLYMSKNIIEKNMHGKIYFENVDGGTCFIIEFQNQE